jgi:hypothetical protein
MLQEPITEKTKEQMEESLKKLETGGVKKDNIMFLTFLIVNGLEIDKEESDKSKKKFTTEVMPIKNYLKKRKTANFNTDEKELNKLNKLLREKKNWYIYFKFSRDIGNNRVDRYFINRDGNDSLTKYDSLTKAVKSLQSTSSSETEEASESNNEHRKSDK